MSVQQLFAIFKRLLAVLSIVHCAGFLLHDRLSQDAILTLVDADIAAAVATLALAWASGNPLQPYLPEPTGLVLTLVGLLLALQSIYVFLSLGPLKED